VTRLAPLLLLLAGPAAAQGLARIDCVTEGGTGFAVLLSAPSRFGPPMHRVSHGRFAELTPCAPQGGWGLSGATGELAAPATEAEGLAHEGGRFLAHLGPSRIVASAALGSRPPLALGVAGATFRRMTPDLPTRAGSMFTAEGEERFACR
jgi:hypothetical protein